MDEKFTHLHVHTDYSLLDGLGNVEDYVKYAKSLGMEALAFTDHGTMGGLVTAYDACKKHGIKFIGGFEAYVAPDGTTRFDKDSNNKYNHLVILFKNEIGYKNGCILLTRSNTEGFYYKPRIDFDLLKEHSEGLIILSACLAGAVPRAITRGDLNKAEEIVKKYKEVFGDDYYLEIQDHGLEEERHVITEMLKLSQKCGVKLVATNDCHYVRHEDKEAHEWLLCMQTDHTIDDPRHIVYEGDYYLKSEKEMLDLFPYCKEAVYNTAEIVEKCSFEFNYGHYRMPKVHIPQEYGNDFFRYLKDKAWEGFERRYPIGHVRREDAKERLSYELDIIKQMNFAEYFLDILKTITWARDHGVLVGPGRGSGAGSCMNYCLGITDLDPLKYDLLFERFLNPERVSMPDIDTDFEFLRKDDIIAFEAESNGKDHFSKIGTYQTMQAKSVLKSCAKVSGIANHVAIGNKLAKFIEEKKTLKEEWEINADLRRYVESDEMLQKIWNIAVKLEDVKKSAGTHACGHIPTPIKCEELYPCRVDSETGYLVCEYDMVQAEHLGNLKKDLLMLRNLTIIASAHREIEKRTGKKIPLWTEEILNDKKALEMISRGETDGVFQLESDGMKKFLKQLQPNCFEDIIAGVALYRPGPMDYIPDYVRNKHHPERIKYDTPDLEPILKPTYGIIVYQEQVMLIVQKLAGFSMGRADVVRKAMGKKKQDIMDQEAPHFIFGDKELGIEGCVNRGVPQETAEKIWGQMVNFAKYAFNKSHAAAYAAISMQTAYLKANYPLEFAAGLFTSVMDKPDKLSNYVSAYRNMGVTILPPDVNKSEYGFSIEGNAIRFGLRALKGVGEDVSKRISENKEPYKDMDDFIRRNISTNKTVFTNLIKAGALDCFGYNRHTLLSNFAHIISVVRNEIKNKDENQMTLFDFGIPEAKPSYDIEKEKEYPFLQLCRMEKEASGMYISGHPATELKKILKDMIVNISDLKDITECRFGGVVTSITNKNTRNEKPMKILNVEDTSGSITVFMFSNVIEKYGLDLCEDMFVYVEGTLKGDDEDPIVFADKVVVIKDKPQVLWLITDEPSLNNLYKLALDFQEQNECIGDYLYIASRTSKQGKALGHINITRNVLSRAIAQFGSQNVVVKEKRIKVV